MIRKVSIAVLLVLLSLVVFSCMTSPQAGTLPPRWWTQDVGRIQNYYKQDATGVEQDVVIFLGYSDSRLNRDKSTAIDDARMDAAQQLSSYLSQKVTGVVQQSLHTQYLEKAVEDGAMSKEDADTLVEAIDERMASFRARVTSTQFSSFKEQGFHVEEGDDRYEAWVAYSMSDQILQETRMLQNQAFETLMEETDEYREIMQNIQEVIAQAMYENIMEQAQL